MTKLNINSLQVVTGYSNGKHTDASLVILSAGGTELQTDLIRFAQYCYGCMTSEIYDSLN